MAVVAVVAGVAAVGLCAGVAVGIIAIAACADELVDAAVGPAGALVSGLAIIQFMPFDIPPCQQSNSQQYFIL